MKGATLKTVTLIKGSRQVILSSTALAAGTYTYSLVVNGKGVDSKQMVITR